MLALCVLLALLLDAWLGEPTRWHPLVGFGRLVQRMEALTWRDHYLAGVMAVAGLLVPMVAVVAWLEQHLPVWYAQGLKVLMLYLAIGWRSLEEHALAVFRPLQQGDWLQARQRLSYMVSRDTQHLDEEGLAKGTVESVLENGNDAIFAAVFWCVLGGAAGVLLFRLANTLDAMWGYRTPRYNRFGWAAARLDDVLNLIPARLTALSYAVVGQYRVALRCWWQQARYWESPNAGPVMAAGAGSLGLALGGAACYHGQWQQRPALGQGRPAKAEDILRALGLIRRTLVLMWILLSLWVLGSHYVWF